MGANGRLLSRLARRPWGRPRPGDAEGASGAAPPPVPLATTAPRSEPDASPGPGPRGRETSLEELRALAAHADQRAALYRRKVLLGRGEPRRLAELERVSTGAAARLRRAIDRRRTTT